jgi:hypothetical protein
MVCSRAEHVFILKNYFTSESFAAVCDAFSKTGSSEQVKAP